MSKLSRVRRHLTFANVASGLALFIAIGGGTALAITLPANSVKSRTIKNRNVRNADLATSAVSSSKLRNGAVTEGKLSSSYELGFGQTFTLSGEFATGQNTGESDTADGTVKFNCAATPTLTYDDIDDGGAFDTEFWDNGDHDTIVDGTTETIASFMTDTTHTVQIFGLGTTTIVASAYVNGATCELAGSVETSF